MSTGPVPPYKLGSVPSSARITWLESLLFEKVLERSANLQLGLKKIFRRFDVDDSGVLEKDELIRTLKVGGTGRDGWSLNS